MNARLLLRQRIHHGAVRAYATAVPPYVPNQMYTSTNPIQILPSPKSPAFYTSRESFYDKFIALNDAVSSCQQALKKRHLLPLPLFIREKMPPAQANWYTKDGLISKLNTPLSGKRYQELLQSLNTLNQYRHIARYAGATDVAKLISDLLRMFEDPKKLLPRATRKPMKMDGYGRAYAVGKRKTSTARVWMIHVREGAEATDKTRDLVEAVERETPPSPPLYDSSKTVEQDDESTEVNEEEEEEQAYENENEEQEEYEDEENSLDRAEKEFNEDQDQDTEAATDFFGISPSESSAIPASIERELGIEPEPKPETPIPKTNVLINNLPLSEYFPLPVDRERVIRPLKLAGVIGAYNVFCIVRGGGTSGQSGAIAHGIGVILGTLEPKTQIVLRRGAVSHMLFCVHIIWLMFHFRFLTAGLLKRDPRMVERKKPGQPKARKKVGKATILHIRHFTHTSSLFFSMLGSSGSTTSFESFILLPIPRNATYFIMGGVSCINNSCLQTKSKSHKKI